MIFTESNYTILLTIEFLNILEYSQFATGLPPIYHCCTFYLNLTEQQHKKKQTENIKQNWKTYNIKPNGRFPQFQYKDKEPTHYVSFSGFVFQENETRKRNPKEQNKENETINKHQKSRRGRRKIAPVFYPPLLIHYEDINRGLETPPAFYMTAIYLI